MPRPPADPDPRLAAIDPAYAKEAVSGMSGKQPPPLKPKGKKYKLGKKAKKPAGGRPF